MTKTKRLTKDGIPIDQNDWLIEDWRDLYYGLEAIKAKIRKRHGKQETQTSKPIPESSSGSSEENQTRP